MLSGARVVIEVASQGTPSGCLLPGDALVEVTVEMFEEDRMLIVAGEPTERPTISCQRRRRFLVVVPKIMLTSIRVVIFGI